MTRTEYRGFYIEVERDIFSGLHSVTHWPVDGDKKEDGVERGVFVYARYAVQIAKFVIDEHHIDLAQLGETK